jgi:predicted RNA methylase
MLANLDPLPAQDLSWLPQRLAQLNFNIKQIAALGDLSLPGRVPEADRQLTGQGPLATLLRAFTLNTPIPAADLDEALGADAASKLLAAGLATPSGPNIQLHASIAECYGAYTLADPYPTAASPTLQPGHVLNLGNASVLASEFTVRDRTTLAADIGCGQGLQAILLAAHADSVIATDVNPRALTFTAANARMKGVDAKVHCRLGSFLDPLQGQKFGNIVSNPPFVIRDAATEASAISASFDGDTAVETLARGAPALLSDHGWFTMICNWHHSSDQGPDWSERPRTWFANTGVDVWILRNQTATAEHYGRHMIRADGVAQGPAFDARLASWNQWCQNNNAKFISFGIFVARRRNGANWMRVESMPMTQRRGAASDLIRNIFAGQSAISSLATPADLLHTRLRRSPTLQAVAVPPGTPNVPPGSIQVQHNQGWAMPQVVAPDIARFMQTFDGSRPCGEQAELAIRSLGGTPPGPDQLARVLISMLRSAFLVPVSASGEVLL